MHDDQMKVLTMLRLYCHALVIVFCVFVICLVRPGCDMGLYVVFHIGVCSIWDRG
jgi:hypothetical protein